MTIPRGHLLYLLCRLDYITYICAVGKAVAANITGSQLPPRSATATKNQNKAKHHSHFGFLTPFSTRPIQLVRVVNVDIRHICNIVYITVSADFTEDLLHCIKGVYSRTTKWSVFPISFIPLLLPISSQILWTDRCDLALDRCRNINFSSHPSVCLRSVTPRPYSLTQPSFNSIDSIHDEKLTPIPPTGQHQLQRSFLSVRQAGQRPGRARITW